MLSKNAFHLAIVLLTISLVGCVSYKPVTLDSINQLEDNKEFLIIHTPTETYTLNNYSFKDSMLIGNLMVRRVAKDYTLHVYSDQSYSIELQKGQEEYVELPFSSISKISYEKHDTNKVIATTLMAIVAVTAVYGVLILLYLFS